MDVLSRGDIYIYVCYCDVFSVVHVYLDHLKLCVVCINGLRYVCCNECKVSDECDEPSPALRNLLVRSVVKLYTFEVFALGVSFGELWSACQVVFVPYVDVVVR